MYMDQYRNAHMDLLSRSLNCSQGNVWVWKHVGQCLEDAEQTFGFSLGLVAIILWSTAHICSYRFQRRQSRSYKQRNVNMFVTMHWCSDVLGCFGAVIAQQLATQIIFGLAVTFVHTSCCIYTYVKHSGSKTHKHIKDKPIRKKSRIRVCIYPLSLLFPAISLFAFSSAHGFINTRSLENQSIIREDMIPVLWVFGYTLGAMAGVLHCSVKLMDMFDSYITVECSRSMTVAYILSICGEIMYVYSVFSQSLTIPFFRHSLPWTLPRLIAAGIDMGILIQRIIQKRRGKRRKLSHEDTECLMSSESEMELSECGSEEMIWMPLKSVESAKPQHPVCASRIQILSESELFSDTIDYAESRRTSSEVFDVGDKSRNEQDPDQTDTDSLDANQEMQDLDNNVLKSQISTLNKISSEEKIATWIHTNVDAGSNMHRTSDIQE